MIFTNRNLTVPIIVSTDGHVLYDQWTNTINYDNVICRNTLSRLRGLILYPRYSLRDSCIFIPNIFYRHGGCIVHANGNTNEQ